MRRRLIMQDKIRNWTMKRERLKPEMIYNLDGTIAYNYWVLFSIWSKYIHGLQEHSQTFRRIIRQFLNSVNLFLSNCFLDFRSWIKTGCGGNEILKHEKKIDIEPPIFGNTRFFPRSINTPRLKKVATTKALLSWSNTGILKVCKIIIIFYQ